MSYDANSIETLTFKDAIRQRVAMYMGSADNQGVLQCVREIITNSIDEATMGYGNKIWVELFEGNKIVIEKVEVMSSFKDADKKRIRIDSKFFDVYKSSNADHHFKFKPSKKLIYSVLAILVALFLVYRVFSGVLGRSDAEVENDFIDNAKTSFTETLSPVQSLETQSLDYVSLRVPRVPDIPSSAPIYDQVTVPVTYPRLFCMSTDDPNLVSKRDPSTVKDGVACQCYTQQATKYHTSHEFCLTASKDGYFDHALPDRFEEHYQQPIQNHADIYQEKASSLTVVKSGKPGPLW